MLFARNWSSWGIRTLHLQPVPSSGLGSFQMLFSCSLANSAWGLLALCEHAECLQLVTLRSSDLKPFLVSNTNLLSYLSGSPTWGVLVFTQVWKKERHGCKQKLIQTQGSLQWSSILLVFRALTSIVPSNLHWTCIHVSGPLHPFLPGYPHAWSTLIHLDAFISLLLVCHLIA